MDFLPISFKHRFVQRYYNCKPCVCKDLYSFKSDISNQTYFVWIERYDYECCAIKFHLKAHKDSPSKYKILTNLGEPIHVINTCINITKEIAIKSPTFSFGFVGECCEGERINLTKRYRFYRIFMHKYFKNSEWLHIDNPHNSSYLIIPQDVYKRNPNIVNDINDTFKNIYPYFE